MWLEEWGESTSGAKRWGAGERTVRPSFESYGSAVKEGHRHGEVFSVGEFLFFQDAEGNLLTHSDRLNVVGEVVHACPIPTDGNVGSQLVEFPFHGKRAFLGHRKH